LSLNVSRRFVPFSTLVRPRCGPSRTSRHHATRIGDHRGQARARVRTCALPEGVGTATQLQTTGSDEMDWTAQRFREWPTQ
jgi:hypothetical protein